MLLPIAARASIFPAPDLAEQAIEALGGRKLLSRVRVLKWDGRATIYTGMRDNPVEIAVETRVTPFGQAISRSWLPLHGSWTARTMTVEPSGGFVEQAGKRTPLPAPQALHELQQFGIYGYLLLVGARLRAEGNDVIAQREGFPDIRFTLGADGRPATGTYQVDSPDGGPTIEEKLIFEGRVRSPNRIAWPARIQVLQKAFDFDLRIDAFDVELA